MSLYFKNARLENLMKKLFPEIYGKEESGVRSLSSKNSTKTEHKINVTQEAK